MSSEPYRQILRLTPIIGGASIITILISVVRVKLAALPPGPPGVGLMGRFSNLMIIAVNAASPGMGTIGTRKIADATAVEDGRTTVAAA